MYHRFDLDGASTEVWLSRDRAGYRLQIADGWSGPVAFVDGGAGQGELSIGSASRRVFYAVDGDVVHIHLDGRTHALRYVDPLVALAHAQDEAGHNVARAPMPGVVVSVKVAEGDHVAAGSVLMLIESMKLETAIRATQDGMVERIHLKAGDSFDRDVALVTLATGEA